MPVGGHDVRQKPVEPRQIGNKLAVKRAGVPPIKDIADIENHGARYCDGHGSTRCITAASGNLPMAGKANHSALSGLEAAVGLVDDVSAAMTAHDLAVAMAILQRLEGVADLHGKTFESFRLKQERAG